MRNETTVSKEGHPLRLRRGMMRFLFDAEQKYLKNIVEILQNKNNQLSTKINNFSHYCNFSLISFFKPCVKEAVVAAVFMFELNLFQTLGPRNGILFYPLFAKEILNIKL